jgi:hypothetical protein
LVSKYVFVSFLPLSSKTFAVYAIEKAKEREVEREVDIESEREREKVEGSVGKTGKIFCVALVLVSKYVFVSPS